MNTIRYRFLVAVLFAPAVFGQTATLRGQVADESGAVIPGARVELSGSTGPASTAISDATGSYVFTGVAPGDYTVLASAPRLTQAQPAEIRLKGGSQVL